jgi:hypothetical protein
MRDVPKEHQLRIARETMKKTCGGLRVLCGMDHVEAAELLGRRVPADCTCRQLTPVMRLDILWEICTTLQIQALRHPEWNFDQALKSLHESLALCWKVHPDWPPYTSQEVEVVFRKLSRYVFTGFTGNPN